MLALLYIGVVACQGTEEEKPFLKKDYINRIAGKSDAIPDSVAQAGEVFIAYSDCYTCHKMDQRSIGPAFRDIAEKYPVRAAYVKMLARKVIAGGSGVWGSAIMSGHPEISLDNAQSMALYILSLKKNRLE